MIPVTVLEDSTTEGGHETRSLDRGTHSRVRDFSDFSTRSTSRFTIAGRGRTGRGRGPFGRGPPSSRYSMSQRSSGTSQRGSSRNSRNEIFNSSSSYIRPGNSGFRSTHSVAQSPAPPSTTLYEELASKLNLDSQLQEPLIESKDPFSGILMIPEPPTKPSQLIEWFIDCFNSQLDFPDTVIGSILQFKLKIQSLGDIIKFGDLPLEETARQVGFTWANTFPEQLTELRIVCKFIGSKILMEETPFPCEYNDYLLFRNNVYLGDSVSLTRDVLGSPGRPLGAPRGTPPSYMKESPKRVPSSPLPPNKPARTISQHLQL